MTGAPSGATASASPVGLPERTAVLVVGGGPVGLVASLLLGQQGIDHVVVERRTGIQTAPAAHVVNARTFEILRSAGVDMDRVLAACRPAEEGAWVRWVTSLTGDELGRVPFELQDRLDELDGITPTPLRNLSQPRLEAILRDHVDAVAVGVEWVSATQDATGVTSTLRDVATGVTVDVRSDYVVAADGAGSRVRAASGITMEGPDVLQSFVMIHASADLRHLVGDRPATLYWTMDPGARGVFVAHDPGSTWVFMKDWDPDEEPFDSFTADRCERIFRAATGTDDLDLVIEHIRPWRMSCQVAARYDDGRIFLVGDAAHRFPPTGGLGLNTGVADVHNLVWKLAATQQGWAAGGLLATYDAERRPVARLNADKSLENAVRILEVVEACGVADDVEDTRAGFAAAVGTAEGRAAIARAAGAQAEHFDMLGLQLGFTYPPGTATVVDDGSAPVEVANPVRRYVPSTRPGGRLPHAWVDRGGRRVSTLDLVPPGRYLLLTSSPSWAAAGHRAAAGPVPLSVVHVGHDVTDPEGTWAAVSGTGADGAVLIRPDQHVAWRCVTRGRRSRRRAHRADGGDGRSRLSAGPGGRHRWSVRSAVRPVGGRAPEAYPRASACSANSNHRSSVASSSSWTVRSSAPNRVSSTWSAVATRASCSLSRWRPSRASSFSVARSCRPVEGPPAVDSAARAAGRRGGRGRRRPAGRRGQEVGEPGVQATGDRSHPVGADGDDGVDGPGQEGTVVAHHHQGPGPVVEEVLQDAEGVEVEVVGGLVEEQHVGLTGQDGEELQPAPLTPRQVGHPRVRQVAREPEPLHQGHVGEGSRAPVRPGHHLLHAGAAVELHAVLVVVAGHHGRTELDPARRRRPSAGEEVEERRLARSVGPHHAQPVTRADEQVDVVEHRGPGPVGEPGAVALDHLVAEPGHGDGQVETLRSGGLLRPLSDERPGRGHPRLGFAAPGLGPAPQPGELAPGQVAAGGLGRRRVLLALGLPQEVGLVPSLVHVGRTAVELEHPGRHPVEQVAVVAHDDQAPGVVDEPVLEPGDGPQVQVVGRLVQDEELTRLGQHPGERHPLGLAPRQRGDVGIDLATHAQPVEHGGRLPAVAHRLSDGTGRQVRGLAEEDGADPAAPPDDTGIRVEAAGEHPQQGGLAGAVDPDHAEPVPGGDGHREPGEEWTVGHRDAHVLEIDEHAHGPTVPPSRRGTDRGGWARGRRWG